METKPCSCKGIRTCLICENLSVDDNKTRKKGEEVFNNRKKHVFIYCESCKKGWKENVLGKHPNHSGDSIEFLGISLVENFISESEEEFLVAEIDKTSFVDSQSGRRKQDYGPKVNFKKKRLKCNSFTGLPAFCKFVVDRFIALNNLSDFVPVELCNLEYDPKRGSAIDPHFDDFWVWGERLITVNLLSDTYLSMTIDNRDSLLSQPSADLLDLHDTEVCIPLPRRSLVVVSGPARYKWKHAILRQDITDRRLAMTFREFTPEFLPGGLHYEDMGHQVIETALTYCGISVGEFTKDSKIHRK